MVINKFPQHSIDIDLEISIKNIKISRSKYVKYLGLWLDDDLKFPTHIQRVAQQQASGCGTCQKSALHMATNHFYHDSYFRRLYLLYKLAFSLKVDIAVDDFRFVTSFVLIRHLVARSHCRDCCACMHRSCRGCNKRLETHLVKHTGMFYGIKSFFKVDAIIALFYSITYSKLQYGILTWGSAKKNELGALSTRLHKMIKTITFAKKFCHISPIFKALYILKIDDIYQLELGKLMCQTFNGKIPQKNGKDFIKLAFVHKHYT